jgi:hypothetical protein
VERIYRAVGFPLEADARAAMGQRIARDVGRTRGSSAGPPEEYGLDDGMIEAAFAPYLERFSKSSAAN